MTTASFGPEWAVLELLAQGVDELTAARLDELAGGELHWGELIEQSIRHKMLAAVAHQVISEGSLRAPMRVTEHLRTVARVNGHRRRVWYAQAARVIGELERRGVVVAARKGVAYESSLYHGNGSRWIGDIDLLVAPSEGPVVEKAMTDLGYQVGKYDTTADSVLHLDRHALMKYRLNPDHLPPRSLLTGDPAVPAIEVDVACSLTWSRSPYDVPIADALRELVRRPVAGVDDLRVPCLSPVYQFLDTVLHLFREAWTEFWLVVGQDVDLMKFGDVFRLFRAYRNELSDGAFRDLLETYSVVEPVCWVLTHLDRTFGTRTVAELGLTDHVDEGFLSSARAGDGTYRHWRGTMRERLHAKDRELLFTPVTA